MATSLYRMSLLSTLMGSLRENVFHLILDPEPSANPYDTADQILAAWVSTFKPLWLAMLPEDCFLESIFVQRIKPSMGAFASSNFANQQEVGTRSGQTIAQQLCPCVSLIPPMGVKSAGRMFLPAVSRSDYSKNVPSSGFLTAISNYFTPLLAGFSVAGGTATLAIFSRKLQTYSAVSAFNLSPAVGYQRHRNKPYL